MARVSRRTVLGAGLALAAGRRAFSRAQAGPLRAYVGTFTAPLGAQVPAYFGGTGPGPSTAAPTGPVAERVISVLDHQINPAIAAHGGHAELVAVEDDTAYLRLSGGCQGCGMASVTLSQGIEVALRDNVPEISRVVDVTDHAAGANPYYEAAKK